MLNSGSSIDDHHAERFQEIEATINDIDETMVGVDDVMDGLWQEFELLK